MFFDTRTGEKLKIDSVAAILNSKVSAGLIAREIPEKFSAAELSEFQNLNFGELAAQILTKFFPDFSAEEIQKVVEKSFNSKNFDDEKIVPIARIENKFFAEMWHGRTAAFKDLALSALPNFFEIALQKNSEIEKVLILAATSGDTGSAGEAGFANSVKCFLAVFFPETGRVSEIQKRQILNFQTDDGRISAFSVADNFDFCQNEIVKKILNDETFRAELKLKFRTGVSTLNSINIGRLAVQIISFFAAAREIPGEFSVAIPTGNFGHALSAFLAKKMGAPIRKILVATNENDGLFKFFTRGEFSAKEFKTTNSPSMDIAIPSNLERILFYFFGAKRCAELIYQISAEKFCQISPVELEKLREVFDAARADETETLREIQTTFEIDGRLLDPHTAVAAVAAREKFPDEKVLILETASWGKFPATVLETGIFGDLNFKTELGKMRAIEKILREKNLAPFLPKFLQEISEKTKPAARANFRPNLKEVEEILRKQIAG
jgi:threonine synthase